MSGTSVGTYDSSGTSSNLNLLFALPIVAIGLVVTLSLTLIIGMWRGLSADLGE